MLALIGLTALGGCTAASAPTPTRAGGDACVGLFQLYDTIDATMSTPHGHSDRMPIPQNLQYPVGRLQSAGCLTLGAELAGMASAGGAPVADSGRALAPPTALHVGVVTSQADEASAVGFFQGQGLRVRTIGAAGLGRRIYIGPFGTEGALEGARELAIRAGFASPYPANF